MYSNCTGVRKLARNGQTDRVFGSVPVCVCVEIFNLRGLVCLLVSHIPGEYESIPAHLHLFIDLVCNHATSKILLRNATHLCPEGLKFKTQIVTSSHTYRQNCHAITVLNILRKNMVLFHMIQYGILQFFRSVLLCEH